MENLSGSISNPATYPTGGTFGQLLDWHLKWGTRPGCNRFTGHGNTPWGKIKFSIMIHGAGATLEAAKKNISNWTNKGKLPSLDDYDRVIAIYLELFDDDPNLQDWKLDLERALDRGRREQAARIARRETLKATDVPPPVVNFMGRDSAVEALARALLSSEGADAVLVQGGPGIGKTELTKAIAHHPRVAARFNERRFFVQLETADTAEAMKNAIIRAIGCDPYYGFQAAIFTLREKPSLLILDNLDTPWEPIKEQLTTEEVLSEISATHNVSILASFRGLEFIGGANWNNYSIEQFSSETSENLFAAIAGQWVRNDNNLSDFTHALGGIPLAINLVARRAHGRKTLLPLWHEWKKIGSKLARDPKREAGRLTCLERSIEFSLQSPRINEESVGSTSRLLKKATARR